LLVPLAAAIAPFVVWPIEYFLPYPYLIEELAKAILVYFILISDSRNPLKLGIIAGLLFGFSETVLYYLNILPTGQISILLIRVFTTIPLHIATTLIILIPSRRKLKLMPWGVLLAIILHFLFNFLLTRIS